jgi:hypothetical protein
MGKFPSHDFHLIVGKFTQDTGDTAPPPSTAAHLAEVFLNYMKFILYWEKIVQSPYVATVYWLKKLPSDQKVGRLNPADIVFVFSLGFSEISEGRTVKSFRKFPKGEGLNCLRKFTGQGTCSHIHSEVFLGNMRCFWDSVVHSPRPRPHLHV